MLSAKEFQYYVDQFDRVGSWEGGLNWYRVMDLDWLATPQLAGKQLLQTVWYAAGSEDMVVQMFGGEEKVTDMVNKVCIQKPQVMFLSGAGHWLQREMPGEVNSLVVSFLEHAARQQAVLLQSSL